MIVNNIKIKGILAILALFLLSTSCVEEYWPVLDVNTDQILVIDGKISNFPGPYVVKLSTSRALNSLVQLPLTNATVSIADNLGHQEILNETSDGVYETSIGGIQGVIGNSYQIRIQLTNGKIYESLFEELLNPVEVESVSVEESVKLAQTNIEEDQEGFQFYVSSKEAENTKTYLHWEMEETYEYHSDYKIIFLYDGNTYDSTAYNPLGLTQTKNQDTLFFCWRSQNITEQFSYSTEYLSLPVVNKLPLHFIPFGDERLRYKYSFLVKQYTISEEAYTFLDKLNQQNNNQQALFTTQPYQIRGNVFNIEDPTEPVFGYFMTAAGTNGPRLFTKAPSRVRYDMTKCFVDTNMATMKKYMELASPQDLPIYFTTIYIPEMPGALELPDLTAWVRQDCLDCERKGGTAIKPEYWDW